MAYRGWTFRHLAGGDNASGRIGGSVDCSAGSFYRYRSPRHPLLKFQVLLERFQIDQQILHDLVTFFGILAQRLPNYPNRFRRRVRRKLRNGRWLRLEYRREHIAGSVAVEGVLLRQG